MTRLSADTLFLQNVVPLHRQKRHNVVRFICNIGLCFCVIDCGLLTKGLLIGFGGFAVRRNLLHLILFYYSK